MYDSCGHLVCKTDLSLRDRLAGAPGLQPGMFDMGRSGCSSAAGMLPARCLLSAHCSSWCIFQLCQGSDGLRGRTKSPLDLFQCPREAKRMEQLLRRSVVHQLPTILSSTSKQCEVPAQPRFQLLQPFLWLVKVAQRWR